MLKNMRFFRSRVFCNVCVRDADVSLIQHISTDISYIIIHFSHHSFLHLAARAYLITAWVKLLLQV